MNSIKKTESFVGRIHDYDDGITLATDEGHLKNIGSILSNAAYTFKYKRVKLTVSIEIEEIS